MSDKWKTQEWDSAGGTLDYDTIQKAVERAVKSMDYDFQRYMFGNWTLPGPFITVNSWYGSKNRSVVRLKYSDKDKGTILIHWKK